MAVARRWQGRTTDAGPVSTILLSALIRDALATDREPLITALVDLENVRSRRLLTRPPFEFEADSTCELVRRADGSLARYLYFERRYPTAGRA